MTDDPGDISFLEHLDQLRSVLLKILAGFAVCCVPCWFLSEPVLTALLHYAAPEGFRLHYFSLMEPFLTRLKIMAGLAVLCSLPFSAWLLWGFIAPGLYPSERRAIRRPALCMFFLALAGALLAAFLIVPSLIRFSLTFAGPDLQPVIGIGDFTGLILAVLLASMVLFQFPVVLYVLLRTGLLQVSQVRAKRPHIVVVIFILAAVFSPPDVMSQLLLAVPAWLLTEASLFCFSKSFTDPQQTNCKKEDV